MSEKFKLTNEEITEVILHSPYSLADSPASLGQRATQIKKYFYDFIRTLAEKINLHMGEINTLLNEYEGIISELQKKDTSLGEAIVSQIAQHDQLDTSHGDIREKISANYQALSQRLSELKAQNELALALASGKSRVSTFDDVIEMLDYINGGGEAGVGDIYLIADPASPDFTVFNVNVQKGDDDIALDSEKIASGELALYPDLSYFVGGVRLISSEGSLETSRLAKREELNDLEAELNSHEARIDIAEGELLKKESALITIENSGSNLLVENGYEYNLGTLTELTLSVSDSQCLDALINFKSGASATALDAPYELYFLGDDTLYGSFYPVSSRLYEISIKRVLGSLVARVGAVDYEVIE